MTSQAQTQNGSTGSKSNATAEKRAATITVTGDGQVRALSDEVVVLVAVEGSGASAAQALHEVTGRLTKVTQALLARGLNPADVQPTWANVAPIGHPGFQTAGPFGAHPLPGSVQAPLPGAAAQPAGFVVSRGLRILLRDPNVIGDVVDTALAAGASFGAGGLLRLRDETQARNLAFEAACQAAHAKASRLADGLGRQLGSLLSLVEQGHDTGSNGSGAGPVAPGVLSNGEILFHTTVQITYELG